MLAFRRLSRVVTGARSFTSTAAVQEQYDVVVVGTFVRYIRTIVV